MAFQSSRIPQGATPSSTPASINTAELLRIVYDTSLITDPFAPFNFQQLSQRQVRKLSQALFERDQLATEAEKEAIERGKPEEIRAILNKLRKRQINRQKTAETIDQKRSDGLTQSRIAIREAKFDILPQDSHDTEHPQNARNEQPEQTPSPSAKRISPSLERLMLRPALNNKAELDRLKLKLISMRGAQNSALPTTGYSGNAHQQPLIQWAPTALQHALRSIGLRYLVDFLRTTRFPEGRSALVSALGVPSTTLLIAARRAELLDLPIDPTYAKQPHIRDVLLLEQLGVRSTTQLARLGTALENYPQLLLVLAEAIGLLQKRAPALYLARHHITRHELRAWAKAAQKRPQDMDINEHAPSGAHPTPQNLDRMGEVLMHWGMQAGNGTNIDPHQQLKSMVENALKLVVYNGLPWPRENLLSALGKTEAIALEQRLESIRHSAHNDERLSQERINTENMQEAATENDLEPASLFTDAAPQSLLDENRNDRMICFWMQPAPSPLTDTHRTAPVYACIDPSSGALVLHA